MATFHRHREVELNLVLYGSLTYLIGGRPRLVSQGELALLWAALPHRLLASAAETEVFWLTVPLGDVLRWNLPRHLVQAALGGQVVHSAHSGAGLSTTVQAAASADTQRFEDWADLLAGGGTAETRHIVRLELEARLRRLALDWVRLPGAHDDTVHGQAPERRAGPSPAGASGHIEKMAAFMADQSQQPLLRVADIAAAAGLHPHYATTLFRSTLGSSLSQYLTQLRVAHAQRLLLTTDQAVLDIMYEVGFRSTSRFHEAFAQACGLSPRSFRKHTRQG